MTAHSSDPFRSYILGRLPADEAAALEQRVFEDDAAFDELLDAEYDLLDAYAAGALDHDERLLVESRLLPILGGSAVGTAQALSQVVDGPTRTVVPAPERRASRRPAYVGVAALVVATCGLALLAALWAEKPWFAALAGTPELATMAAAARDAAPRLVPSLPTLPPLPVETAIVLDGRLTRGASVPVVSVPPDADIVRLRLPVSDAADAFRVEIEGAGPAGPRRSAGLRAADGFLDVWLPASRLDPTTSLDIAVYAVRGVHTALVASFTCRIVRE